MSANNVNNIIIDPGIGFGKTQENNFENAEDAAKVLFEK